MDDLDVDSISIVGIDSVPFWFLLFSPGTVSGEEEGDGGGAVAPTLTLPVVVKVEGLDANRSDLVLGFKIIKLHCRFSSTEISPPALSNSPQ